MATAAAGGRDRYEPIKRLALVQIQPPRNPNKPLTSFFINDILNEGETAERKDIRASNSSSTGGSRKRHPTGSEQHRFHPYFLTHHGAYPGQNFGAVSPAASSNSSSPGGCRALPVGPLAVGGAGGALSPGGSFVRPWADSPPPRSESCSGSEQRDDDEDGVEEEISVDDEPRVIPKGNSVSPLDALLQMTSKTFDGLDSNNSGADDPSRRDQLSLFAKNTPPKKRRKSRTAFTNQQIYELEKRFLYQKYLTPADRDEIAAQLGLSNAQVITWFQNRRAKLKRDLEELKADVTAAKSIDGETTPPIFDSEDEYQAYKNRHRNGCSSEGSNHASSHQGPTSPKSPVSGSGHGSSLSLSVSINAAANMAARQQQHLRDQSHDLSQSHDDSFDHCNESHDSDNHSMGPNSPEVSVTSPTSSPPSSPRCSTPIVTS